MSKNIKKGREVVITVELELPLRWRKNSTRWKRRGNAARES